MLLGIGGRMKQASVRLENLTLSYRRHPTVHHVSGIFEPGSLTAITGPNGAGKSTLLRAIAGTMRPDSGHITIENALPSAIAYLPQAMEIEHDFPFLVLPMVATGLWNKTGAWRAIDDAHKEKAMRALAEVKLKGFAGRRLGSLSAGQFQRALFARLLVQDAPLILLDEPFAAIDAETTAHLLEIIHRWHKEKRTVICVLHDLEQIKQHFPECLLLARECVAWGDSRKVLAAANLKKARHFPEAWEAEAEECAL